MEKINFDENTAKYYDKIVEAGYHNNEKYLSNLFKTIKKGESVLELGCGTGKILLKLLEREILAEGVDISPQMVKELKRKNSKTTIYNSNLLDFKPPKKYDYVISCNGPFSIKENNLESYILDEKELGKILKKYLELAKKGLLINKGIEKPKIKIDLDNKTEYIHKEVKVRDYVIMIHFIFQNNKLIEKKIFTKRRYDLKEILNSYKIEDLGEFYLIF